MNSDDLNIKHHIGLDGDVNMIEVSKREEELTAKVKKLEDKISQIDILSEIMDLDKEDAPRCPATWWGQVPTKPSVIVPSIGKIPKPKVTPLFDDIIQYPKIVTALSGIDDGDEWPDFSQDTLDNMNKEIVDEKETNKQIFIYPLWLGKDETSSIMATLNHVYSNHGNLPVNGVFVIQDAIKNWMSSLVNKHFYISVSGMVSMPPSNVGIRAEGVWDIECNLIGLEVFNDTVGEVHGTPLRLSITLGFEDSFITSKAIHESGRFYLTGKCDVENDDIVSFEIASLNYIENSKKELDDAGQNLILHPTEDTDMPF